MKKFATAFITIAGLWAVLFGAISCGAKKPGNGEAPEHPAANMEFVPIPAGKFMMGSNVEDDEKPLHEVTISKSFEMGKYEVTQDEFTVAMGGELSPLRGSLLPVTDLSWEEIQQYINLLNSKSSKFNYRLPTEAEWEYACRAGSSGDYAGELDALAWYDKTSDNKAHTVGKKKPNAWGLYDMHGNVWEWCLDKYGPYSPAPATDPQGPNSGSLRVFRGGGWYYDAKACRSASRDNGGAGNHYNFVGFRLVRTPR